jgi:hypothetical protein
MTKIVVRIVQRQRRPKLREEKDDKEQRTYRDSKTKTRPRQRQRQREREKDKGRKTNLALTLQEARSETLRGGSKEIDRNEPTN